jgi:2-C-methyl-D-erythritol 4-phosphate cytidylyltransferase
LKQIFGLVPAAGIGARMGADRPKQYLQLGAQSLLERSVRCLLADARVVRVLVVTAPGDAHAAALTLPARCATVAAGGATRAHSVRNGLQALLELCGARAQDDWVLVHDAVRPCLTAAELAALIEGGAGDEHGALLALPITDTVKRAQDGRAARTVDRTGLWRALTPQLFRIDILARALDGQADVAVTDESSAVEQLGLQPRLIAGRPGNIKITTSGDLALAEAVLRQEGMW